jgi:signal transduction histidine kinase
MVPDEISMKSDRGKVRQILLNVLDNACKFTKEGEVQLRISSEQNHVVFHINDNGIGMTRAEQNYIFDAFKQADGSTARKFEGAGLGLAITHRLCVALDGEITVSSIPQQGSTFTIRLPQMPREV